MSMKLIIAGVVVLALASTLGYVIHRERQDAAQEALENVRKNNEKLGKAAESGALDYNACRDAGRLWNYRDSRCGGFAPYRGN